MAIDLNRIRANSSSNDRDAYRYYREVVQTRSVGGPGQKSGGISGFVRNRPVVVALSCFLGGIGVVYGIFKYREEPEKIVQVEREVAKLKAEFEAYNERLR